MEDAESDSERAADAVAAAAAAAKRKAAAVPAWGGGVDEGTHWHVSALAGLGVVPVAPSPAAVATKQKNGNTTHPTKRKEMIRIASILRAHQPEGWSRQLIRTTSTRGTGSRAASRRAQQRTMLGLTHTKNRALLSPTHSAARKAAHCCGPRAFAERSRSALCWWVVQGHIRAHTLWCFFFSRALVRWWRARKRARAFTRTRKHGQPHFRSPAQCFCAFLARCCRHRRRRHRRFCSERCSAFRVSHAMRCESSPGLERAACELCKQGGRLETRVECGFLCVLFWSSIISHGTCARAQRPARN